MSDLVHGFGCKAYIKAFVVYGAYKVYEDLK